MAGYIPQDVIEDIRSRADIVDIISGYIPLKKSGRNYRALCPFHNEKTPSFMVSPGKQIFHCFGCGAGGNVFNFVMMHEHLSFYEALKKIGLKVGVKIPEPNKKQATDNSLFNRLLKINELTMLFYHKQLLESAQADKARAYLKSRGYDRNTAVNFKLGFASGEWQGLFDYLRRKEISEKDMLQAGLVSPKQGGGFCDKFRNRLMFPIFNSYDKVIGFGARVLDKGQMPKYLNSSDSVVFSKGKNLYGLNWAKKAILDKDRVIIVEGYTDCIRAHEKGFSETVATLGTALTAEQARALKRYTKNFVLIYDADEAGELAALRNLDVLLSEDITPKIAVLPAGSDPDNFLNEKNLASFEKIIDEARNIFDYKLQQLLERYKVDNAEDKTIIAHEFLPTISAIPDKVTQSDYIRRLAEKLDIKEDHLLFELNKVSKTGNKNRHKIFTNQQNAIDLAEKILLVIMLEDNSFIGRVKEEVDINDCVSDAVRPIYSKVFELYEIKQKVEPASLMNELDSDELRTLIASVFMDTPEIKDKEKNFNDCIKAIKIKTIDLKLKKIKIKQKDAQLKKMHDAVAELLKEANALIKEKIKLTKK